MTGDSPPEALDHAHPVVGVGVFRVAASVEHEQVDAALRQEELVRGVHDLLPAEVPDVQPHRTELRQRQFPIGDLDPVRFSLATVELVVEQSIDD